MTDNPHIDTTPDNSGAPPESSPSSNHPAGGGKFNISGKYGKQARKPRAFRIALIILLFLLILFVAAIYFLPSFLPMDTIRSVASQKVREATGMEFDFRSFRFSWSGGVVVEGITLAPPAPAGSTEKQQPLATVDDVLVNVAWTPLLSGRVVVKHVEVNGFSVRVTRDASGKLNLPEIPASAPTPPAAQAESAPSGDNAAMAVIPALEIQRVELNRGNFSFIDQMVPLEVEAGLEFLRIEGSKLDQPFRITGKLVPYPSTVNKGSIDFTGNVRLLKELAFDPAGEAGMDILVSDLPIAEYAEKFALGSFLPAGHLAGTIKLSYQNGIGKADLEGFTLAGVEIGLGENKNLRLPDTVMAINAVFDPKTDRVDLGGLSVANSIKKVSGSGWVAGVMAAAEGKMPYGELDFNGVADLGAAIGLMGGLLPEGTVLPPATGEVGFAGKVGIPKTEGNDPLSPTVAVDFTSGKVSAPNVVPGVSTEIALGGVGVQAVARLSDPLGVVAKINMKDLPVTLAVEEIGVPLVAHVRGGVTAQMAGEALTAELRLVDSNVDIPATSWAGAMKVVNPEARITFDMQKDVVDIAAANLTVNDSIKAGVRSGRFTGILAGKPEGNLDAELSLLFESVKDLFQPLLPADLKKLSGSLRGAARVGVTPAGADVGVNVEIDNMSVALDADGARIGLESPKTKIGMAVAANLADLSSLQVTGLKLDNAGSTLQYVDAAGASLAARLGETLVQVAGTVDPANLRLSVLDVKSSGMTSALGRNGAQTAAVVSGPWILKSSANRENPFIVPIPGEGDFHLPDMEAGVDNLVFRRPKEGGADESALGNIRLKFGVDGRLGDAPAGSDKYPVLNLRRLELAATPVAAQAKGRVRLDNMTAELEYAARLAPARIQALLHYLQIPPELLNSAEVSGRFSWNGSQLTSAGASRGGLQFASGQISPFTVSHDFSASYSPATESLEVAVRGLNGGVSSPSGESIVSIAAQPSTLVIGKDGAKGFVDLRVNGTASPTRIMALGLARLLPEAKDIADLLQTAEAAGVYQAWVQLQGKDNQAAVLNLGGIWQGAALAMGGAQFLSEPGRLGASLVGEYQYGPRRLTVSKLSFNSDSGQLRAEGTAGAILDQNASGGVTGLSGVTADLRFAMGDLAKLPAVFPGVIPADLGLTGKIDGQFKASGTTASLGVDEGVVRFQGVQGRPGGMNLSIPQGTATYGGTFSLNPPGSYAADGSDFAALRSFNLSGGHASLTGAQFEGRTVTDLSAAFRLEKGVFHLDSAKVNLSGQPEGSAQASGTVDFNPPLPAANLRLAAVNMPLAELASELHDFFVIQSGAINLPATPGGSAGVAFSGLDEDSILQSIRLDNFNFATGPVVLHTGPAINAELDRARMLLKQEPKGDDSQDRVFSFRTISGTAQADGTGVIVIPQANPIHVIGDNTGDFAVYGSVSANRTIDLEAMIAGQIEKILTFSLPNIIPNLRQQSDEEKNQFMKKLNQNAAAGHYKLRVSGPLDSPAISGIPELVARILTDIPLAAPFAIIGGVLNLGKDAPAALLNAPETLINAPKNVGKGIGNIIGTLTGNPPQGGSGLEGQASGADPSSQYIPQQQAESQQQTQQQSVLQQLFRHQQPQQQQAAQPQATPPQQGQQETMLQQFFQQPAQQQPTAQPPVSQPPAQPQVGQPVEQGQQEQRPVDLFRGLLQGGRR